MQGHSNELLNDILSRIFDLFAEEVGPVAPILCDEVRSDWEENLHTKGQKPGLRHIPNFVHQLSLMIEDENNRKTFVTAVFKIEALSLFKNI